jgi:hypothetical protein
VMARGAAVVAVGEGTCVAIDAALSTGWIEARGVLTCAAAGDSLRRLSPGVPGTCAQAAVRSNTAGSIVFECM